MLIFLDLSIFLTTILFIGYFYSTNYIITLYYKKGEFTQDKKWNYAKFVMICTLFVFSLLFSLLIFRFESEVKNLLPQFKEYISFYNYTFCFFVLLCMVPYILHYFNNVYFDLFEEKFFKKNFLGIFIFTSFLSFPVFIINSVLSYICFIGLLIFPEKIKNHSSAFNMSMFFIVYNSIGMLFMGKNFAFFGFLLFYDFYFSFNDKEKMLKDRIIIRILYFLLFLLYFVLFLISLIFIPSSFYSFLSYVGFLLMLAISIFTIHCSYYFYVIFIEMFYRSIYNKSYWLGE